MPMVALAAATALSGCVTKKMFNENFEDTGERINSVETAIEANERRLRDLSEETDDKLARVEDKAEEASSVGRTALSKADAAEKAAEEAARGKLLWTVTISDDNVRFGFDERGLSDDAEARLDELAREIKALQRAVYLEIEGHTDDRGPEAYNRRLGEQRAEAVRRYLNESGGIPLHAMNVISYGESRPVGDNASARGRAQNRRVVIRVLE